MGYILIGLFTELSYHLGIAAQPDKVCKFHEIVIGILQHQSLSPYLGVVRHLRLVPLSAVGNSLHPVVNLLPRLQLEMRL